VHGQAKIAQTELSEVISHRLVRVEVVIGQIAPTQLASLSIVADELPKRKQQD
jgi:hypothetical protein